MADMTSVRAKIADALNEADTALGQPTDAQTIAALNAQVAKLTADLAAETAAVAAAQTLAAGLQSKIDAAKAALA